MSESEQLARLILASAQARGVPRGREIELADPAGSGLTAVTPSELKKAWMLGARRGRPWMATISVGFKAQ